MTDLNRLAPEIRKQQAFIAEKLAEVADLLFAQGADAFRVRAYREASRFVATTSTSLRDVLEGDGQKGLVALPTIGTAIARAVAEMIETGDLGLIARLPGELDPEVTLQTVPTIGPGLGPRDP